jgi:hypothetical protein
LVTRRIDILNNMVTLQKIRGAIPHRELVSPWVK